MYTKKTKLIGVMLAVIMILQIVCTSMTSVVLAAVGENEKTITFADANLYAAIKEALGEKIKESNDETNTFIITDDNISKVVSLDLTAKGITDLSGIENFVLLKELNLFDNKIENLDSLASLSNLEKINLTNNNIESCTILEGLTNLTSISIGSQDLEKVAIVNKEDIVEESEVKSFTYTLPQVFKYIYDRKVENKENIDLSLNIVSADGNVLANSSNYELYEDTTEKALKLKVNISEQETATIEIKYNSGIGQDTKLILHLLAITEAEKVGIKFEDKNLYNAVRDSLDEMSIFTKENKKDIVWYTNSTKNISACTWYDNILTLVINKNYLYKDITSLDLVDKKIENLEGLQYFVALTLDDTTKEQINVSNNYIDSLEIINKLYEQKEISEKDLQSLVLVDFVELVKKRKEFTDMLTDEGEEARISEKISELKSYVNSSETELDDEDKNNLSTYFLNVLNTEIDRSSWLKLSEDSSTYATLKRVEKTDDEDIIYKARITGNKLYLGGTNSATLYLKDESISKIKEIASDIVNILDGEIYLEEDWKYRDTTIEAGWHDGDNLIDALTAEMIDALNETDSYYDVTRIINPLTPEILDLTDDEIEALNKEEAKKLLNEILDKYIAIYDNLTDTEKTNVGTLENIKTTKNGIDSADESKIKSSIKNYINEGITKSEIISYLNTTGDNTDKIVSRFSEANLQEQVKLPAIKSINLSCNNLKDITGIDAGKDLRYLNLFDNLISDISNNDFTKFEKLLLLELSHNRIYEAKIGSIPTLQVLNLSNNYLSNTNGIDFKGFEKLQRILLSGNRIYDLKDTMYNLYELAKIQKSKGINQILTWTNTSGILASWTELKEFGYTVDESKISFKNQTIYASATKKVQQDKEEYVYLPEIFNQVKDITCGTTTFTNAKSTNDGMIMYLDTSRLGEQVNSAVIEGTGFAAGTICYVSFVVATEEEINEIPATGVQIQLEKTLTDNENAAKPDFNNDGKVNSEDLEIFNKYWLGSMTLTEAQENLAKNIVPDNNLTKEDHLLLVKYVQNGWDDNKLTDEQRQKAEEADITGDNEVTNDDFIVLSNYLIGGVYSPYIETQIIAEFDINGDSKVTAVDAICMSRYLTSKSTEKINIDTLTLEMLNDYKQSKQLYAELSPENTTQKDVEWVSHDERIVKVDSNGKVTAVATGTTQITVKSTKNANVYDTISVTVKAAADIVTNIKLKDETSLAKEYYIGQELNLEGAKAVITKLSGKEVEIDITKEMVKGFDTTVATTEPRIITVEYTDEFETTVQTTFNITVVEFTGEDSVTEVKLVPPTKLEYNKNEELDLAGATIEKVMGSGIKQEPVNVTADMISGYDKTKPGKQTVTVTYAGKTATFEVMVNNPVTGVNLDKAEYTIVKGGETHLVATVMPEDAVNRNVTWASSDENIATVDDAGKVAAVGIGTATITVTTKDGAKSTTCKIIVKEQLYSAKELSDGTIVITGINPETTEEYFRDKFLSENTYEIVKQNPERDIIATGDKLRILDKNGTVVEEQILVVKGDTNGDGKASATDSGAILAHRTGEKALENEYLLAADINNDGIVDGRDSTLLIYHRIGMAGYILQNN